MSDEKFVKEHGLSNGNPKEEESTYEEVEVGVAIRRMICRED